MTKESLTIEFLTKLKRLLAQYDASIAVTGDVDNIFIAMEVRIDQNTVMYRPRTTTLDANDFDYEISRLKQHMDMAKLRPCYECNAPAHRFDQSTARYLCKKCT